MTYIPKNALYNGEPLTHEQALLASFAKSQAAIKGELLPAHARANFARPSDTTAYAALDVVNGATGANRVFDFSSQGISAGATLLIILFSLRIDISSVPSGMAQFRLHLFRKAPTVIADNAAFEVIDADAPNYLGFIETPTPYDLGSKLWSATEDQGFATRKIIHLGADETSLYGVLQTVGAYTPTSGANYELAVRGFQFGS